MNEKFKCELVQIKQNTIENVEQKFGSLQNKLEKREKLIENQKSQLKKSKGTLLELNQVL